MTSCCIFCIGLLHMALIAEIFHGMVVYFLNLSTKFWPNIIIVRSRYHYFPKAHTAHNGHFEFLRVQDLIKYLTGLNSCPEFQHFVCHVKRHFEKCYRMWRFTIQRNCAVIIGSFGCPPFCHIRIPTINNTLLLVNSRGWDISEG